jgi:hypothetical protein
VALGVAALAGRRRAAAPETASLSVEEEAALQRLTHDETG